MCELVSLLRCDASIARLKSRRKLSKACFAPRHPVWLGKLLGSELLGLCNPTKKAKFGESMKLPRRLLIASALKIKNLSRTRRHESNFAMIHIMISVMHDAIDTVGPAPICCRRPTAASPDRMKTRRSTHVLIWWEADRLRPNDQTERGLVCPRLLQCSFIRAFSDRAIWHHELTLESS
jgi:hypothetical protein